MRRLFAIRARDAPSLASCGGWIAGPLLSSTQPPPHSLTPARPRLRLKPELECSARRLLGSASRRPRAARRPLSFLFVVRPARAWARAFDHNDDDDGAAPGARAGARAGHPQFLFWAERAEGAEGGRAGSRAAVSRDDSRSVRCSTIITGRHTYLGRARRQAGKGVWRRKRARTSSSSRVRVRGGARRVAGCQLLITSAAGEAGEGLAGWRGRWWWWWWRMV